MLIMLFLTYAAAIFAALLNASSSVIQRLATSKPDASTLFSRRFAYEMIKSRMFLSGVFLQICAFVAMAIALKNGPLIIVEPILTCDLVFLLLLIHWKVRVHIQIRDWLSVAAIIAGLSGVFAVSHPQGGHLNYNPTPWIILGVILGSVVIALGLIVRRLTNPGMRAILAGIAASCAYASNAAFTKLTLNTFANGGFLAVITNWPVYALVISGLISIYLMLNAYGSGPLAISQPIMEVFEPAIAVAIGISIFGDSYNTSIFSLGMSSLFIIVLVGGIVTLASSPKIHQAGKKGI